MKIAIINEHIADNLGGSEMQCDIIAKTLQDFGHQVTYLAVKGTSTNYSCPYRVEPVRLSESSDLKKALQKYQPDVVYWRYNRKYFYQSMKIIGEFHIPVVFSVSHKNDVNRFRTDLLFSSTGLRSTIRNWKGFVENWKQFKGFQYVDGVSNQCRDFMGRLDVEKEIYFPNSILKKSTSFSWNRRYCVWASSIKKRKDPESLIKLARELSNQNVDILVVGEIQESKYHFFSDPNALPDNVHYLGLKTYEEVNGMLEQALCLIHTCYPEGFPNNFIQAWAYGKPVVSLHYDPDGLIKKHNMGFYSKTFSRFTRDTEKLLSDSDLRRKMGENAQKISGELFNSEKNVKKLELFMSDIITGHTS